MKSVQFSTTNIMYSPLPWSPSPGASTSSLPPSPPATPPPIPTESAADQPPLIQEQTHDTSPGPLIYSPWPAPLQLGMSPRPEVACGLPGAGAAPAQIHLLLSFSPLAPPNVHYDVTHPLHTLNPQLTPSFLDPATYPPMPALTLRCRHIDWPISVAPSQPGGCVTVLDVLAAVYAGLRPAVARAEYDALPSGGAREKVDAAYFARCRLVAGGNAREAEALKGVKRVDFLAGRTRFMGLSGPLQAPHVWELNVS
ncbi:hypothetical protein DFH07DRAFT_882261 [Mycena maculata]|uniref:DUF6699 domain-containing protein n=1 Tax=Mycena maculata TaxID=230809 RepID=A0AAD7JGT1_9AGAR|nr:hypothetical protein DFH07DRAFT_882261 [Mycena maculata]